MKFEDKYIGLAESVDTPDYGKKIMISDEAYAIGEMLDKLIKVLVTLR